MSLATIRILGLGGVMTLALACSGGGLSPPDPDAVVCGSRIQSPVPTEVLYVPGEIIVGFVSGTSEREAIAYLEDLGLPIQAPRGWDDEAGRRYVRACVTPGDEEDWVNWFESEGDPVEYAHVNHIGRSQAEGGRP